MKTKTLLLFLVSLFASTLFASAQDTKSNVKYQAEIQVGTGIAVGDSYTNLIQFQTIQGVMVGEYFSTGIGTGADFLLPPYPIGGSFSMIVMPLYANFKGYLPVGRTTKLFASLDLGTMFNVFDGFDCGGFTFTPALGVAMGLKNDDAINLSVGYESVIDKYSYGDIIDGNRLIIKIAYRF